MDFIPSHKRAQTKTHSPWFAAQNFTSTLATTAMHTDSSIYTSIKLEWWDWRCKTKTIKLSTFLGYPNRKTWPLSLLYHGQHFPVLVYRLAKNFSSRSTKKAPIIHLESCHGNFENLGHWHTSRLRGRNSFTGTNSDSTFTQRAKITKNQNEKWSLVSASATISSKFKKN